MRARVLPLLAVALAAAGSLLATPARAAAPARSEARDASLPAGAAPVWILFGDKGLGSAAAEDAAIARAAGAWTDRARARRARVGGPSAADLLDVPVHAPYVDAVRALGVTPRTRSRWLNAVSAVATPAQRAALEALPCVASVRPVARGRRAPETVVPVEVAATGAAPAGRSLDYGECGSQILPIEVDRLHDRGLSGAGVLVALLDTGFRRTHDALLAVDVFAEHDFINDDGNTDAEPGDPSGQPNHGSIVLSSIGGWAPGHLIGPAYGASFALAKTEDIASETPVEEDYWVAAAEWADSLGADLLSTSLSYIDWYTYEDMDGDTAPITIAADLAVSRGIAVFASAGNQGNLAWYHIGAPADGDSVITVGAVDSLDVLASFSSRGPTFDGRTKPDVCALGAAPLVALPADDHGYGRVTGTSLSCPLAAGVGALLLEAHPAWSPVELADALRGTASHASVPDNDTGWGVVRGDAAWAWSGGVGVDEPRPAADALAGARVRVSPNPAHGAITVRWSRPAGGVAGRLVVVDVTGRRVRDLGPVAAGATTGAVAWDGRDENGRPVAPGIRFARLETAEGAVAGRIVHLR